ncbi:vacuolar protein-sorting protein BRO1 [Pseudohyphozyma bogoriensis]|nr:vacuolar protein-sorting protein BRO1 [Pseudohyphozyma bogoriensis]
MTSPLIWVPKKSTQDVDFAPHLKSVISRTYAESPEAYADELAQLNRSRQDALRGSAGSDVTGRDLLYKYFGQLELLELRFPELRVPFPWNDAFTNVKISQLSLAYEKASVIFNIGSTLSSLAASSPRSSPEGLKRAFHSFRCAAGMFTYINDNFLHAPSTDLSREVVKVLVGLMSAQAVEVFVESMPKESKLRPKLCMQAATLYGGIMEEVKEWVAKSVFIKEWSWLIQTKAKYFQSLANYYKSLQDTAAGSYGPALARLTLAQSLASEAHKLSQSFSSSFSTSSTSTSLSADAPSSLLTLTKTHLTLLTDALASANKDNDLVYNAVVPSVTSLPAIEGGKSVADPIAIHDVYATPEVQKVVGADLFAKLVPLSVHESASLYSEEKAKLVRGEQERCDVAEGENVAALEYMGLPSGLEKFRVGIEGLKDPGREIRSWCEEIVAGETEGGVDALLNKLVGLRESARSGLEESKRELDREERECESMRSRFGHLWEMEPSAGQTRSLRGDFQAHERSLGEARGSDERVMGIWEGVKRDVAIMADPSGRSVEALFASVVSGKEEKGLLDVDEEESGPGEEVTMMVDLIAESLAKLNKVKKERDEVLKDLKERVQADDISHLLILNRKGPASVEPTLFASELEKFRAHQTRITATIQHQQSTLAEISAQLKALNDSPRAKELQGTWSGADRKRKEVVERLRRAKQAYGEVRDGATKGVMFYEDLSSLVGGLKDQVRSFVRRRDDERDRMASTAAIKQRLEGGGGSSGLEGRMGGLDLGSGSSLKRCKGGVT